MADDEIKSDSKSMGIRIQKKLLSKMASKKIAKAFIDDTSGKILDDLYKTAKLHSGKKDAEKVIKNAIKIVIKLGILYRNDVLTGTELQQAEMFKRKFHTAAMTICSFYEVEFSYERQHLQALLHECRELILAMIQPHLTDKSSERVHLVFDFFSHQQYLDSLFSKDSVLWPLLGRMVSNLHVLMDRGEI